jgi:hypothetical protein
LILANLPERQTGIASLFAPACLLEQKYGRDKAKKIKTELSFGYRAQILFLAS